MDMESLNDDVLLSIISHFTGPSVVDLVEPIKPIGPIVPIAIIYFSECNSHCLRVARNEWIWKTRFQIVSDSFSMKGDTLQQYPLPCDPRLLERSFFEAPETPSFDKFKHFWRYVRHVRSQFEEMLDPRSWSSGDHTALGQLLQRCQLWVVHRMAERVHVDDDDWNNNDVNAIQSKINSTSVANALVEAFGWSLFREKGLHGAPSALLQGWFAGTTHGHAFNPFEWGSVSEEIFLQLLFPPDGIPTCNLWDEDDDDF